MGWAGGHFQVQHMSMPAEFLEVAELVHVCKATANSFDDLLNVKIDDSLITTSVNSQTTKTKEWV